MVKNCQIFISFSTTVVKVPPINDFQVDDEVLNDAL